MAPAQQHQENLFFYHFIFVCLTLQYLKEHPVLIVRFLLCHEGLNNVSPLSVVLYVTFWCLKRRSFEVILIFLWRD